MKRSEPIRIQTEIEVKCEASKSTAFGWKIFKTSKNLVNYQPFADHEEPKDPVWVSNQPELNVPKTELNFGFYKCVFTVSMEDVDGVSGKAVGYIHVVATQSQDSLQAFVDGGPRKRYKFGRNVSCRNHNDTLRTIYDRFSIRPPIHSNFACNACGKDIPDMQGSDC